MRTQQSTCVKEGFPGSGDSGQRWEKVPGVAEEVELQPSDVFQAPASWAHRLGLGNAWGRAL